MHDACQSARSSSRKIRLDTRDGVFGRQHATSGHRAQSLTRFQFLRGLLKGSTSGDKKKRSQRANHGCESGQDEYEAMFAETYHRNPGEYHNPSGMTRKESRRDKIFMDRGAKPESIPEPLLTRAHAALLRGSSVRSPSNQGPQAGSPPGVVDREGFSALLTREAPYSLQGARVSSPTVREGLAETL